MVNSCSAYGCSNKRQKGSGLIFHQFPLKNKELNSRWIAAVKREGFVPTANSFLCGKHFVRTDYKWSDSNRLKDNAIPTIFNFPEHLQTKIKPRKPPLKRKLMPEIPSSSSTPRHRYH